MILLYLNLNHLQFDMVFVKEVLNQQLQTRFWIVSVNLSTYEWPRNTNNSTDFVESSSSPLVKPVHAFCVCIALIETCLCSQQFR